MTPTTPRVPVRTRTTPLVLSILCAAFSLGAHADTKVRTSSFAYNAQGFLNQETVEPTSPNDCLKTTYTFDAFGNKNSVSTSACAGATGDTLSSATAARSASTSYGTNGQFALTSTNALGQSETKTYDARFGVITSLKGPNGLTTTWTYDNFGRKTKETRADNTYTTWAYKLCTDAGANCPVSVGGAAVVWFVIEQSYAVNAAVNAPEKRQYYDTLDRVVRTQTQGYDGAGVAAPTVVQDTEYNALGQIKRQSNTYALVGDTPVWSNYTYDALGQLLQTNAAGSITKLQYNQRGQKTAMQDPAMGSWTYSYNAFGELVKQTDSLGQVTTIAYDILGRMTQRTESDLVSTWSYDKKFDNTPCGKGIGKLCEAKSDNGYKRAHSYDTLGRLESTSTLLDANATVSETFDANTGRVSSKTWPTGYKALYSYTPLGYLKTVTGKDTSATPKTVSYTVQKMNAQGQITQYLHGNNVTVVKNFDAQTQRLNSQLATTGGQATTGNVLTQAYQYDALGNLTKRTDNSPNVGTSESFSYDSLNRLSMATLVGGVYTVPTSTQVLYDARGNITYKSDVGRYWYDAARPNRMTNVTLETAPGGIALTGTRTLSYAFDDYKPNAKTIGSTTVGNGNLEYTVSQDPTTNIHTVRYESYTSFNMPAQISTQTLISGALTTTSTSSCTTGNVLVGSNKCLQTAALPVADRTLTFVYGPEHQRIKQNIKLSTNGTSSYFAGNVWYLNGEDSLGLSYEKEVRTNGTTEHKHYVSVGGQTFAIFTSRTGTLNGLPATSTSYLYHDQLGSISAIADETGKVVERLAYDPWGKRRFINTNPGALDKFDAIVGIRTDRGFTEHEHLDEVGVIHMNGRIYDPLMGRFMSADPIIEAPNELASYNRYSYVWNSPLNRTDPSGFCFFCDPFKSVGDTLNHIGDVIRTDPLANAAVTIAITYFGGPGAGAIFTGLSVADRTGSIEEGIKAGLISYATMRGFEWAGTVGGPDGANSFARYAAHATVGCVSSVASGGSCASGAASAAFGKFATNQIGATGNGFNAGQFAATVVAGGVGSVIAGGEFANGAKTAAFGYLFNQVLSSQEAERRAVQRNNQVMQGRGCVAEAASSCAFGSSDAAEKLASVDIEKPSLIRSFVSFLFPVSSAPLTVNPIGGSVNAQVQWGETVWVIREAMSRS